MTTTATRTATTVKTIEGKRMNVRVIFWDRGFSEYQVQYEFSRKGAAETIWRNVAARDGGYFFTERATAFSMARRVHARNNNY